MELALYDPGSATTPAPPSDPGARAIFLPASTSARSSASCSTSRSPRWRAVLLAGARPFDLVEAGAGNGRLSADVLPRSPDAIRRCSIGRACTWSRPATRRGRRKPDAGRLRDRRLASSSADLPTSFEGVLFANELLDALPVHQVVMRAGGLREVYVTSEGDRLTTAEGPLSTPALAATSTSSASRSKTAGGPRSTSRHAAGFVTSPRGCSAGSSC